MHVLVKSVVTIRRERCLYKVALSANLGDGLVASPLLQIAKHFTISLRKYDELIQPTI